MIKNVKTPDINTSNRMQRINCDLGECLSPDPDATIMPLIDQASIACGGHVGDIDSMTKTVALAAQYGVEIGAHPSYPDKAHFGRKVIDISELDLFESVLQQVTELMHICQQQGATLHYLKPHGALYHQTMKTESVFKLLAQVIKQVSPSMSLMVQADVNSNQVKKWAEQQQIQLQFEAFADRKYAGVKLVSRNQPDAVLSNPKAIISQYQRFSEQQQIDSICFHSDHEPSVQALQLLGQ